MVQPFARSVFEMHRAEGRPLVLATTTPYDLVKPFADRLGLDDVIATRYGLEDDGDTYDGTLAGPFVWSAGKLEAVRAWAEAHDVDLAASWFYSDSVYDTPLMSVIGHPVVVNPDPRMVLMAAARRWPTLNLDVSPGVAKVPLVGLELQRLAMAFTRPSLVPYADIEIDGVEHIPADGPAILVGNHRSYFDAGGDGDGRRQVRTHRALPRQEGGVRRPGPGLDRQGDGRDPRRSRHADRTSRCRLRSRRSQGGEMVALMPQGTIPRGPAFFEPELKGRWGAARLAQLTGAPVIPVGLWGTEKVWPRSARVPQHPQRARPARGHGVGRRARSTLKHKSLDADTKRIMKAIVELSRPRRRLRSRTRPPEELAATYPPGLQGRPASQGDRSRRPGTRLTRPTG